MSRVLVFLLTVPSLICSTALAPEWVDRLGLEQVWKHTRGDGIVIAVVDTGVDASAINLEGAVLPGRAFPDLGGGDHDEHGHGTQVATLIAGRNGQGVAPGAAIVPLKVSGGAEFLAKAIDWAVVQGVDVVNISQGNPGGLSVRLDQALRRAAEQDVVVVAAAGNASQDGAVTSPADHPDVLAVAAVDGEDQFRPDVSVHGPEIAIAAPGVDLPIGPDGERRSGTSYSAAIVSGVLALVMSRYPKLDGSGAVKQLLTTARDRGKPGRDPRYGFGVIDPVAATTGTASVPRPWWLLPAGLCGLVVLGGAGWWVRQRIIWARA